MVSPRLSAATGRPTNKCTKRNWKSIVGWCVLRPRPTSLEPLATYALIKDCTFIPCHVLSNDHSRSAGTARRSRSKRRSGRPYARLPDSRRDRWRSLSKVSTSVETMAVYRVRFGYGSSIISAKGLRARDRPRAIPVHRFVLHAVQSAQAVRLSAPFVSLAMA